MQNTLVIIQAFQVLDMVIVCWWTWDKCRAFCELFTFCVVFNSVIFIISVKINHEN